MLLGASLKGYFIGIIDVSVGLMYLCKGNIKVSGGVWEVYMPYLNSEHKMGILASGDVSWDWINSLKNLFCGWDRL